MTESISRGEINPVDLELDLNPFYTQLTTKSVKLFRRAQAEGYNICIPALSSLEQTTCFSSSFLELHFVKPSRYFVGVFDCGFLSKRTSCSVQIEDTNITAYEGFSPHGFGTIRILDDEVFYGNQGVQDQYHILIISRAFGSRPSVDDVETSVKVTGNTIIQQLLQKNRTLENHVAFISSFPSALTFLDSQMASFRSEYVISSENMVSTAKKLAEISEQATSILLESDKELANICADDRLYEAVCQSIESYNFSRAYQKVWRAVLAVNKNADESILKCLINAEKAGAEKITTVPLLFDLTHISNQLILLDGFSDTIDKLRCLRDVLRLIAETVRELAGSGNSAIALTTDDFLAYLVHVLIASKPLHLASNIFYMETFQSTTSGIGELSHGLINVQAALLYVRNKWGDGSSARSVDIPVMNNYKCDDNMLRKLSIENHSDVSCSSSQNISSPSSSSKKNFFRLPCTPPKKVTPTNPFTTPPQSTSTNPFRSAENSPSSNPFTSSPTFVRRSSSPFFPNRSLRSDLESTGKVDPSAERRIPPQGTLDTNSIENKTTEISIEEKLEVNPFRVRSSAPDIIVIDKSVGRLQLFDK